MSACELHWPILTCHLDTFAAAVVVVILIFIGIGVGFNLGRSGR